MIGNNIFDQEFDTINKMLLDISTFIKEEAVNKAWDKDGSEYEATINDAEPDILVSSKFTVTKKLITRLEKQFRVEAMKDYYKGLTEYQNSIKKHKISDVPDALVATWKSK